LYWLRSASDSAIDAQADNVSDGLVPAEGTLSWSWRFESPEIRTPSEAQYKGRVLGRVP